MYELNRVSSAMLVMKTRGNEELYNRLDKFRKFVQEMDQKVQSDDLYVHLYDDSMQEVTVQDLPEGYFGIAAVLHKSDGDVVISCSTRDWRFDIEFLDNSGRVENTFNVDWDYDEECEEA